MYAEECAEQVSKIGSAMRDVDSRRRDWAQLYPRVLEDMRKLAVAVTNGRTGGPAPTVHGTEHSSVIISLSGAGPVAMGSRIELGAQLQMTQTANGLIAFLYTRSTIQEASAPDTRSTETLCYYEPYELSADVLGAVVLDFFTRAANDHYSVVRAKREDGVLRIPSRR